MLAKASRARFTSPAAINIENIHPPVDHPAGYPISSNPLRFTKVILPAAVGLENNLGKKVTRSLNFSSLLRRCLFGKFLFGDIPGNACDTNHFTLLIDNGSFVGFRIPLSKTSLLHLKKNFDFLSRITSMSLLTYSSARSLGQRK